MSMSAQNLADEWIRPINDLIGSRKWEEIDQLLSNMARDEEDLVTVCVARTVFPVRQKLSLWQEFLRRAEDKVENPKVLEGLFG